MVPGLDRDACREGEVSNVKPHKEDKRVSNPQPRCTICGGVMYGSLELHYHHCPFAARAIEQDRDKERM